MADIRRMSLGQVVDYVIAFNNRQRAAESAEKDRKPRNERRKATQADINAFFG